ncbi:MAG: hypothetical protein VX527_03400 [Planctomycetota bacterium]|nr:hypothetical protein [Planctomycetota bacterium]
MLGLVVLGVASAIPVVQVDGQRYQGWEAAEISFRFLIKDFPKMPMGPTPIIGAGGHLNMLGLGTPQPTTSSSPMDGVMVSTGLLGVAGLEGSTGLGKVYLYWVAWSWTANAGLVVGLITLLGQRKWLRRIRAVLVSVAWLSVLIALIGGVLVIVGGKEPLLFGPAYWAWLISLVIMGLGVTMAFSAEKPEKMS